MSKHTKGPWKAVYMPEEGGDHVIIAASGISVALSIGGTASEIPNARLIAAAPELLEALEDLITVTSILEPTCLGDEGAKDNAIYLARSAIAKATGEQK